jgi:precorrin-6B methylase 2
MSGDPRFEAAFAVVDRIGGWLTRDQASVLWAEASTLGARACVVEVGSHQGRSTVTLALANPAARVVAIDPFLARGRFGGRDTRTIFGDNLARAGVDDVVTLLEARSEDVLSGWSEPVDLVFVDGKHDAWSAARDFRWADHLGTGRRLLVHDAFSSIGVTLAVLTRLLPSRRLRYVGRAGSLATFEVGTPALGDRLRLLAALPWWVRNVAIKVLLRLRLRRLARFAGHHDTADPY